MPTFPPGDFGPPNPSILKRQAAVSPPYEVLPVGAELRRLAQALNCPGAYVLWFFLAFTAGLIGNARRFCAWPTFVVPCNLYVLAVGAPSASKTPPFRFFRDHCLQIEREEAAALRRTLGETVAAHHRIIVDHVSMPSLIQCGARNPAGLIMAVDEASRLTQRRDQTRQLILEGYNGGLARVDLITREAQTAEHFLLSLAGTIQTALCQEMIRNDSDGCASRFVLVPNEPVIPQIPASEPAMDWLPPFLRRLRNPHASPAVMMLDEAARGVFGEWWTAHRTRVSDFEGPLAAFENKLPGTALRLAGIRALIAWALRDDAAPPAETIGVEDVLAAITLVEDYARPAARQVYGDAAVIGAESGARRLAGWILQHKPARFNARLLYRGRAIKGLSTADHMAEATAYLTRANWLKPARAAGRPGRPLSDFRVNPAVLAWAEEEAL
jgi:hypothetical protein